MNPPFSPPPYFVQSAVHLELPATLVFDYPTTSSLSAYLHARLMAAAGYGSRSALAVHGMPGRQIRPAGFGEVSVGIYGASSPGWDLHRYASEGMHHDAPFYIPLHLRGIQPGLGPAQVHTYSYREALSA